MICRALLFRVVLAASFVSPAPPNNLLVNGSFEEASINPGSYHDLPAGSTVIRGWTVTLKHIDLVGTLWKASEGKYSLDLDGSACNTHSPTDCFGGIQQTFSTVPGQKYDVTFDFCGNPGNMPKLKIMRVSAAGESGTFTFDITGHSFRRMGWRSERWSFTAKEANTTLEFASEDKARAIS